MAAHRVALKQRREVAEGTTSFSLEKPAGFEFKPGQFLELKLLDPPETDAEGNSRAFSIASAPGEPDLLVATRMRDTAMKRVLRGMELPATVEIEGPFGNLLLHRKADRHAVFLAGGIGITPFRSMIVDAVRNKLPLQIYLFYSNRRPEDAAFLEELQQLAAQNSRFRLVATMTAMAKSHRAWKGETGLIGKEMIARYVSSFEGPVYYVAGPPEMVSGLRKMLNGAGVSDDDIRAEEFAGY